MKARQYGWRYTSAPIQPLTFTQSILCEGRPRNAGEKLNVWCTISKSIQLLGSLDIRIRCQHWIRATLKLTRDFWYSDSRRSYGGVAWQHWRGQLVRFCCHGWIRHFFTRYRNRPTVKRTKRSMLIMCSFFSTFFNSLRFRVFCVSSATKERGMGHTEISHKIMKVHIPFFSSGCFLIVTILHYLF